MDSEKSDWFAVRCVFELTGSDNGHLYEERITLWRAASAEEAIARAETDAREYAHDLEGSPDNYVGLAQSFHLFDVPADGAEVFSLLRESALSADEYLSAFFDTGTERQDPVGDRAEPPGSD